MNKHRIICFLLLFIGWGGVVEANTLDSIKIISYNVENLFDNQHDSLKNDSAFLPNGLYHWTYRRYQEKLDRIAQVIVNIAGWEAPAMVGLCEVENARCLRDLCYRLRRFHYRYVHYESADERGIDVALLYDSTQVKVMNSKAIPVLFNGDATRDVLYVCGVVNRCDTIHTFVCHLPSQRGGSTASEWKRNEVKSLIQNHIDSINLLSPNAKIVVMGDMNTQPKNDLKGMKNLMVEQAQTNKGTNKYQGIWSFLDQFYVSYAIKNNATATIFSPQWLLEEDSKYLDYQPKRTYVGYRYHNGYSDHLPIVLTIQF